ncbi:MAG: Gfo/Idh/MocA family oxidoreductase [Actinomycetota bacterium]
MFGLWSPSVDRAGGGRSVPGSSSAPFRWGFIGAGHIASTQLAPAVHASTECVLYAAAARDIERARALEPVGPAYADYAGLCADPDVDGVYISLHNTAHLEWIKHALAAGKHVLCEKPLCLTEAETAEAFDAAAAAGRTLVEAFWYRWHPRTRRAEQLVTAGELGDIVEVEAAFCFGGLQPDNIRLAADLGGGALYDVGCYTVSAAQWALGDLSVMDASARYSTGGVDLQTHATLAGRTGRARVECSIDSEPRDAIVLRGSAGTLEFTGGKGFAARRADAVSLHIVDADGVGRDEPFPAADAYRLMTESFARLVRGGDEFVMTPAESLALARTTDAIRSQARAGSEAGAG